MKNSGYKFGEKIDRVQEKQALEISTSGNEGRAGNFILKPKDGEEVFF